MTKSAKDESLMIVIVDNGLVFLPSCRLAQGLDPAGECQ